MRCVYIFTLIALSAVGLQHSGAALAQSPAPVVATSTSVTPAGVPQASAPKATIQLKTPPSHGGRAGDTISLYAVATPTGSSFDSRTQPILRAGTPARSVEGPESVQSPASGLFATTTGQAGSAAAVPVVEALATDGPETLPAAAAASSQSVAGSVSQDQPALSERPVVAAAPASTQPTQSSQPPATEHFAGPMGPAGAPTGSPGGKGLGPWQIPAAVLLAAFVSSIAVLVQTRWFPGRRGT